jgi:hypothetical protein
MEDGLLVLVDFLKEGMLLKYLDSTCATVKSFPLAIPVTAMAISINPAGNVCAFATDVVQGKSDPEPSAYRRPSSCFLQTGRRSGR